VTLLNGGRSWRAQPSLVSPRKTAPGGTTEARCGRGGPVRSTATDRTPDLAARAAAFSVTPTSTSWKPCADPAARRVSANTVENASASAGSAAAFCAAPSGSSESQAMNPAGACRHTRRFRGQRAAPDDFLPHPSRESRSSPRHGFHSRRSLS
jgi:hypothetical protein